MASGNLLYDAGSSNPVLCDNLETLHGMRGGRKFKTGELCVYLGLIHVDVWQKLTQYCKAIILQLKNKIKNRLVEATQRRQWQHTSVLLPGKSHGRRSLVGCSPWGHEESDMTE